MPLPTSHVAPSESVPSTVGGQLAGRSRQRLERVGAAVEQRGSDRLGLVPRQEAPIRCPLRPLPRDRRERSRLQDGSSPAKRRCSSMGPSAQVKVSTNVVKREAGGDDDRTSPARPAQRGGASQRGCHHERDRGNDEYEHRGQPVVALRRLDGVEAGGAVKDCTDRGTDDRVRRSGETNKTSTARAVTSARAPYVRSAVAGRRIVQP